ncbi:MAG: Omp28-related outer membrane protein [Bacteroidota bacterium]
MKNFSRLSNLILLAFFFASCDIIEPPFVETINQIPADEQCLEDAKATDPFGPSSPAITRKVLFEEMTGHKCGNCPAASETAVSLTEGKYAGQMILVGVHAGPLSLPDGSGKYETDYRTSAGNELYSELNAFDAVPFGAIDRASFGLGASTWDTKISQRLQVPPKVGLRIFNCYDADSAAVTTVIDVKFLEAGTNQEYLAVYLVEDEVIDYQKDYRLADSDIPDYHHHNVLREAINGTWGVPLTTETVNKDDRFTVSYSFKLSDDYDPAHCRVVAFVHQFDTYEIHNAEIAEIQ